MNKRFFQLTQMSISSSCYPLYEKKRSWVLTNRNCSMVLLFSSLLNDCWDFQKSMCPVLFSEQISLIVFCQFSVISCCYIWVSLLPLIQLYVLTCLTVHQDVQHRLARNQLQIWDLLWWLPSIAKVMQMRKTTVCSIKICTEKYESAEWWLF